MPVRGVDPTSVTQVPKREWITMMARTRKPSWIRLVVDFLAVVGVCVGLVMLGVPYAGFIIVAGAVLAMGRAVSLVVKRPKPPEDPQGWRMDSEGDWRWWDGSAWTEAPAGEIPRKISPEIEW
jgi:hypothetical protein